MTNIIVAFPKLEDGKIIKNVLVKSGFQVSVICTSGSQALQHMDDLQTGIILCGYRFSDMLYTQVYENRPRGFEMLLVASQNNLTEVSESGVQTLAMPLRVNALVNATMLLTEQVERQRKKRRLQPIKRSEEEKQAILQAKERLMKEKKLTESEAHKYLQKTSMDSQTNMVEAAYMVLKLLEV